MISNPEHLYYLVHPASSESGMFGTLYQCAQAYINYDGGSVRVEPKMLLDEYDQPTKQQDVNDVDLLWSTWIKPSANHKERQVMLICAPDQDQALDQYLTYIAKSALLNGADFKWSLQDAAQGLKDVADQACIDVCHANAGLPMMVRGQTQQEDLIDDEDVRDWFYNDHHLTVFEADYIINHCCTSHCLSTAERVQILSQLTS